MNNRDKLLWEKIVQHIPEHMRTALYEYITEHKPVGSFLKAVLCNDLMGALKQADDINLYNLHNYGIVLYNYAPSICQGSVERYNAWIKKEEDKNENNNN